MDGSGTPVDVEGMQFHSCEGGHRLQHLGRSFAEKSTEVSQVVVAAPAEAAVGQTSAAGVTISDANGAEGRPHCVLYRGTAGLLCGPREMRYITPSVDGAPEDANIYVNNRRLEAGQAAEGIRVTAEDGEKLVRVIVQRGEQEPAIYLLKLTSSAQASDEIIEQLKLTVSGQPAEARTHRRRALHPSVGHDVDRISIHPVCAPRRVLYGERQCPSGQLHPGGGGRMDSPSPRPRAPRRRRLGWMRRMPRWRARPSH